MSHLRLILLAIRHRLGWRARRIVPPDGVIRYWIDSRETDASTWFAFQTGDVHARNVIRFWTWAGYSVDIRGDDLHIIYSETPKL